jgi:hypothetical protein
MDKLARLGCAAVLGAAFLMCSGASQDLRAAVKLYNAACEECRHGDLDRSAAYLIKAVKAGFVDISHLRRDPDLRPLRTHPVYQAIVAARDAADEQLSRRRLERWRQRLQRPRYRHETDERLRLSFVCALDETAYRTMRRMLESLNDHLARDLFAPSAAQAAPTHHVIVVVPEGRDAAAYLTESHVEGVYHHGRRELIAADAGRVMRHEFVHALHHRHMDALGQDHAAWVQEGLACLYEEYRVADDGAVTFPVNDRQPLAHMLAANDRLIAWPQLLTMSSKTLRAEAPRAYPQLRSIFRYIAEQDRLQAWYDAYVGGFHEDPSGLTALEVTLGSPVADLERRWRRWLDGQPDGREGGG